jgi:drug/metabolite transporter (DMT)-like permease
LLFAVVIIMLDRLGRKVPPGHLSIALLAGSGLPSLVAAAVWSGTSPEGAAWPGWTLDMLRQPNILLDLLLLTIFPTVLSMHWMSVYQPRVPASRAALIYLLEPVFGAALSIAWGHDKVTYALVAGGCLILGGNLLVELPMWLRDRMLARRKSDLR